MKFWNYFALLLCIILLVPVALSLMPQVTVAGGAGNGIDEEVKNLTQTADIVEFVAQKLSQIDSGRQTFSSRNANGEAVYKNATLHDETSISQKTSGAGANASIELDREMTVYLTESASYYVSEGTLYTLTEAEEKLSPKMVSISIDFKIHLYISDTRCLLKIDRFDMTSSSDMPANVLAMLSSLKNVWIDCTSDYSVAMDFQEVSQLNNAFLFKMGSYFREHNDNFTQNDEIYTLKQIYLSAFTQYTTGVDIYEQNVDGSFTVDLSDATKPNMTLIQDYSGNYYNGRLYENFTFENINNTVISVPDDLETVPLEEVIG